MLKADIAGLAGHACTRLTASRRACLPFGLVAGVDAFARCFASRS